MGTESDKPNTAVVATIFAMGTAAMIGGSAALVGLARGEIDERRVETEGFANLQAIRELETEQRGLLSSAKVTISEAEKLVLAEIRRDPNAASPVPVATADAAPTATTAEGETPPDPAESGAAPGAPVPSVAASATAPAALGSAPALSTAPSAPATGGATTGSTATPH
jgi:hypothetical protein